MVADDGSSPGTTTWPMPRFRFEVDFGTELKGVAFQEITGMDAEAQVIEYRAGNSPHFSPAKMPGIKKYGNVTMRRGVFANEGAFWNWQQQIKMNTIQRQTVIVKLLDEQGNVSMQWTLSNAWPTKITGTDLKAEGAEVTIETIEIAHEGMIVSNGS